MLSDTMPFYHQNQVEKYWDYATRFCALRSKKIRIKGGEISVLDDSGCSNKEQLSEIIKGVMLRRLKKDVLSELPTKSKTIIPICSVNKQDEKDFMANLQSDSQGTIPRAEIIEKYRKYAINKKLPEAIKFISDIAENEKVIVGIHHREPANKLYQALKEFNPLAISGKTTPEQRQKIVNDFQNKPEHRVIICSIKAAGVGITLTAASKVVILETMWSPGELEQFSDRAHRIGQTNNVDVYYLVIRKSIDSGMMAILVNKNKNISEIVDGNIKELFT
jgi:SWI/SNF-related matrix-associated actin-dependent regulator 1 of chromatin subfamily A